MRTLRNLDSSVVSTGDGEGAFAKEGLESCD